MNISNFFLIKISYVFSLNLIYEKDWFFLAVEARISFVFFIFWAYFWGPLENWDMSDYRIIADENESSEINWTIWLNLISVINYISYAKGFLEYLKKCWRISEILSLYRLIKLSNLLGSFLIFVLIAIIILFLCCRTSFSYLT
jgi:hypothetical protein